VPCPSPLSGAPGRAGAGLVAVLVVGITSAAHGAGVDSDATTGGRGPMARCAECHREIVESYLAHGMARSLGPVGAVEPGVVVNPASRARYEIAVETSGPTLTATLPRGGVRRQRLVGRIGAGRFDTSWAAAEMDTAGASTGRLFFAPVETIAGRGLALSPFERHAPSPSVDLPLTQACLTCHTGDRPAAPFPPNLLGSDAFARLSPLSCAACHGETGRHADIMSERIPAPPDELGIVRLGKLPPGVQRDVCARCHLQGDARFDLVEGRPRLGPPLAGQIPVLVPRRASADFRFVGQLERLALSACFKGSPAMTCTTCHRPHSGVTTQGVASFDQACLRCHRPGRRHTSLTVRDVTGHEARSAEGCVDCHVRRSQPFDLPHVRSADHFIQRRIARPQDDVPHRPFADREGELALFDDGRLSRALATPAGGRWHSGVLAVGLATLGRFEEAARQFDLWQAGAAGGGPPDATAPLADLAAQPSFHTMRGMVAMAGGKAAAARAAFAEALALDPRDADALMSRARLRFDTGDVAGALADTQAVIEAWPEAERPWDLRAEMAARAGRPDLVRAALEASARRWPSNARVWLGLARLRADGGDAAGAQQALARARSLDPGLDAPRPR
jgi:Tetratricopeptide repeat